MIYISTSCVRNSKIKDSVYELALNGFKNIELSGGTEFYQNFESDLLELKYKYNLNYRCHNYFPPPKKPFVLNIASLDDETFQLSFNHIEGAISLCERLGSDKFSFHAGFFIDIRPSQVGRKIKKRHLFDQEKSVDRFCAAYNLIDQKAKELDIFIENNVFSRENSVSYSGVNPFMLTSFSEYQVLKQKIDFKLLLDIAHLKVSAKTLKLDWRSEFENMITVSNYIHVSDNNGLHDSNRQLTKHSDLFFMLREADTKNKDFTLEVYDDLTLIRKSYETLSEAIL